MSQAPIRGAKLLRMAPAYQLWLFDPALAILQRAVTVFAEGSACAAPELARYIKVLYALYSTAVFLLAGESLPTTRTQGHATAQRNAKEDSR
jgi:hypothetical protein